MNNRIFKLLMAVVCILLVLVYASAMLLPHSHESGDENCAACALIKSSSGLATVIGLCFIPSLGKSIAYPKFDLFRNALILHDSAPVWLKVKLSD